MNKNHFEELRAKADKILSAKDSKFTKEYIKKDISVLIEELSIH
jgi:hypothetical protein